MTERELAVLAKASSGASNAEIAAEMYLSEDTIKTHLARTYRKLGATTRVGAVVIAMRQGLLLCACEHNAR